MKILEVLTYYRPHISGLTIYVERLSRALARQGHEVTVFTSQYDRSLPRRDRQGDVDIIRVPVLFRISKGVIMPRFGPMAWKLVPQFDVVHLHLPQFDAPGVALRGRLYRKPVVLTYHSDLDLPPGIFNGLVERVVHGMNRAAGKLSDAVVTYTCDFGRHSPFLSRYMDDKLRVIPPPVELETATEDEVISFRDKHKLSDKRVIGISARIAAEKGIEVLIAALPRILKRFPNTHVLHASPDALGEEAYFRKLEPLLEQYSQNYHLLGPLHGTELSAFYRNLDCLVICSLNNTETFGLVQIEAMMNGVPSVASALPGVRQPVEMTGMGEVVPIGDSDELAAAIMRIFEKPERYLSPAQLIAESFSPEQTASEYHYLFRQLLAGEFDGPTTEPESYVRLRQMRDRSKVPD